MNPLTNAEMADMHLAYGAADGNARRAARIYQERFPNRQVPGHRMFTNLHRRLRETGRFSANRVNAGRPRRIRLDVEEEVLEHFHHNPRTSTRAAAVALGIRDHSAVWRVLNENHLHPFHFQRVQGLVPADYRPRERFAQWFLNKELEQANFSEHVLFTDEAFFNRDGVFNVHNNHEWQLDNPHVIREHGYQQRYSVNVWAGIVHNQIIGPYILPSRLTGNVYRIFLEEVLPGLLENVPLDIRRRMWFQHDGAPAHFHIGVRDYINARFPHRWIGRNGPVSWPARSPDMTPLDLFFWGHMKSLIYETPVESEEDLVARIAVASADIAEMPGLFANIRHSLRRRYQTCINVRGRHFEQLL
jgi:hypothetical protein